MEKLCDLHTHSTFSDGSFTPTELVLLAKEKGLEAIALTDHNTAMGLPEFMEAGRRYGVETVAGCEFTTEHEKKELHIVGLFFPEDSWKEIEDYVELMRIAKRKSNRDLIGNLQRGGYDITYEEAQALTGGEAFNRAHVAEILVKKGYVSDKKEAFETLLKEGNGFYSHAQRLGSLTTVRFIKMYGGRAVLAHPFLNMNEEELIAFLPAAKEEGLDAIETLYSEFDEETTRKAEAIAQRFGLLRSGGSDFHGARKKDIDLGSGRGGLKVPYSFCEELKRRKPDK